MCITRYVIKCKNKHAAKITNNKIEYKQILIINCIFIAACRYEKGAWGDCNAQSQMTRNDKLKPNSDPSCEQNRQTTKKCKPKGVKPTKGKGTRIAPPFFSSFIFI